VTKITKCEIWILKFGSFHLQYTEFAFEVMLVFLVTVYGSYHSTAAYHKYPKTAQNAHEKGGPVPRSTHYSMRLPIALSPTSDIMTNAGHLLTAHTVSSSVSYTKSDM
jgi:hypothetical protein